MTEQQVILQRQEKEQQDKVTASVPDKKRLAELEMQVKHLKKGKEELHLWTHDDFYFITTYYDYYYFLFFFLPTSTKPQP